MEFNQPGMNMQAPAHCMVDFSLVPVGTANDSYAKQIADVQRLMEQSGLKHELHPLGTVVEGPWEQVARVIGYSHFLIHQEGVPKIQTDIRMISSKDKVQHMDSEVEAVRRILTA